MDHVNDALGSASRFPKRPLAGIFKSIKSFGTPATLRRGIR